MQKTAIIIQASPYIIKKITSKVIEYCIETNSIIVETKFFDGEKDTILNKPILRDLTLLLEESNYFNVDELNEDIAIQIRNGSSSLVNIITCTWDNDNEVYSNTNGTFDINKSINTKHKIRYGKIHNVGF